jgi:FkbM family methyltransferase
MYTLLRKIKTLFTMDYGWAWKFYKKHSYKKISYTLSRISGRKYWDATIDGLDYKLSFSHPYHHLIAHEYHQGLFEQNLLYMWKKAAEKSNVILDLGAYNGAFAIVAAKATEGIVMAVEPDPTNAHHVKENIRINNLHNCTLVQAGIAGPEFKGMGFTLDDAGTAGHLTKGGGSQIKTVTLDDLCEKPDLIKMDIEGMEANVLMNSPKTLAAKPTILLELHYNFLSRFGDETEDDVLNFLHGKGYVTVLLDDSGFARHYWCVAK